MPVVAIFSGVFCGEREVAERVAQELGCALVGEELFAEAGVRAGLSPKKIQRALVGETAFLQNVTHERERALIGLRAALAERLRAGDAVYLGPVAHLVPRALSHVLKVCLVAERAERVRRAGAAGIAAKEAAKRIGRGDRELAALTQELFGKGPWDASLYDIKIPMHKTDLAEATRLISSAALGETLRPTAASLQAVLDLDLAARVNGALLAGGHHYCDVTAQAGQVTVLINKNVLRIEHLEQQLKPIAQTIAGVTGVEVRVGPKFNQPDIYRGFDFEMPTKILLVDDEKEYVLALSERLELREFAPQVAYDGEEALAFLAREEPRVMVLDLRMPGIDGIEVLRRVKRDHPQVEVIILTGHGSERDEQLALELGAFAYLQKPVDLNRLVETMKQAQARAEATAAAAADRAAQAKPQN